ncbi:hypothetical protein SIO70_02150 [Chitinophaga sancti]|uniref:hypothetical protein n=1 Tax=Chitinophaga sancti TaxID=1004 RepID=UPI002A74775B|nr:hypothetical protein [Chitinophaga sancti]WPQ63663.1 hypothetical protein SIO70_02150 [Chitinophaga sancti]
MPLKELLLFNNEGKHLTYSQYLSTNEWMSKREEIIKRDNFQCTQCKKKDTIDNYDPITKKTEHLWLIDNGVVYLGGDTASVNSVFVSADKHYHLEVHHTRYILNRLPWDYKNEDLITFCNHCHTEFHLHHKVPVYSGDESTELEYEPCPKCNGKGYIPDYFNVQNGICFQCRGEKYIIPII